jgi:hypothetical protein
VSDRHARLTVYGQLLLVDRVCSQLGGSLTQPGDGHLPSDRWVASYRSFWRGRPGRSILAAPGAARPAPRLRRSSGAGANAVRAVRPRLAGSRAGAAAADRAADPAPPPGTPAGRVRPAHRCGDPRPQDHDDPATNAAGPGELVHMDVKKIGKIPDGGGWKAHCRQHGRTSAQKKAQGRRLGVAPGAKWAGAPRARLTHWAGPRAAGCCGRFRPDSAFENAAVRTVLTPRSASYGARDVVRTVGLPSRSAVPRLR